jgi:hypothetical protein
MHTYRSIFEGEWEVGYYLIKLVDGIEAPVSVWETVSTHPDETSAIRRVNLLNGGKGNFAGPTHQEILCTEKQEQYAKLHAQEWDHQAFMAWCDTDGVAAEKAGR